MARIIISNVAPATPGADPCVSNGCNSREAILEQGMRAVVVTDAAMYQNTLVNPIPILILVCTIIGFGHVARP